MMRIGVVIVVIDGDNEKCLKKEPGRENSSSTGYERR